VTIWDPVSSYAAHPHNESKVNVSGTRLHPYGPSVVLMHRLCMQHQVTCCASRAAIDNTVTIRHPPVGATVGIWVGAVGATVGMSVGKVVGLFQTRRVTSVNNWVTGNGTLGGTRCVSLA
jgi:hypothetical protein